MPDTSAKMNRRAFFATTGAAALSAPSVAAARVAAGENVEYQYEITRTDAEWQEMLTAEEYVILREGFTEAQKTSPFWDQLTPGVYNCRGCELPVFDGRTKAVLDKGWVFFDHAIPASVMTNIDGNVPEYGAMATEQGALMEIHCRRCGSHLGHYLRVNGKNRHCINGTSLTFTPETA